VVGRFIKAQQEKRMIATFIAEVKFDILSDGWFAGV
jgi:hypothetical protein